MKSEHPYNIFLDDERWPEQIYPSTMRGDWTIIRTYSDFILTIQTKGLPDVISFDHDLEPHHYPTKETINQPIDYSKHTNTGYHCAVWLVEYLTKNNECLPEIGIHSFNPVGRENIRQVLQTYNFKYQNK